LLKFLRNVATRKGRFRGKTLWLRMAGENGSDGRCGKVWEVSCLKGSALKREGNRLGKVTACAVAVR
jgi:hypothetical protein